MQCTAKSKRSGEQCKNAAMAGKNVCRMHGGKSLGGLASPRLKTGRYSKYLPLQLADRYQEALDDGELLALRDEVALVDARVAELLARVNTGESGALWQQLRETFAAFRQYRATGNVPQMGHALAKVEALIERGGVDSEVWREIALAIEQRRRLVESERKRLVEMQQTITAEQAMVLLAAVVDTVKRNVTDRAALAAISADLGRLVANQAGGTPVVR